MRNVNKWVLLICLALSCILILASCVKGDDPASEENGIENEDMNEGTDEGNTEDNTNEDSENSDEAAGPVEGGDLIMAMPSDIVSLDPHGSNDSPSSNVRSALYETLIYQDENMELHPHLAEEFEQVDETTWEFKLREGITFHDGEPFTAEAVKATFERVLDPDLASQRAFLFDMIEEVEVIDEYNIRITTEYPFAPLAAHLAHDAGGIISPKAIEDDYNGDINLDIEAYGTGPFKLESWGQGEEVVISRNEDYWGDPAYLDTVTFKVVPEQLTRIGMLENNEAHIADQIESTNASRVENTAGVQLIAQPRWSLTYAGFNTEKEPFDDPNVRKAISMAIDTDAINEGIYQGYGTPAKGPINDLIFGYKDDLEGLPYDPEAAKDLLAEAGYEDGFSTTLWTNDDNPERIQTAEYIQDQLEDIGIDVEIELVERGAFLDATGKGAHEMLVLGWVTVTGDADYGMYSLFHSSNKGAPGNRSFYENEKVDELLDQARRETDVETREQLYHEVQEILVEEAPMIYTIHNDRLVGVSEQVHNFSVHPNDLFLFHHTYLTEDDVSY